jgi:hypothetical protein
MMGCGGRSLHAIVNCPNITLTGHIKVGADLLSLETKSEGFYQKQQRIFQKATILLQNV